MNSRRRPNLRAATGFTLIEVLATIALMAIVLPVAMNGVSVCLSAASTARHRTEAGALGQAKLSEIVVTQQWSSGGSLAGDFGQDWPDYRWEATVIDWQPAQSVNTGAASSLSSSSTSGSNAATNPPRQLDLRVTWKGRTGDQYIQLSTLVYVTDTSSSSSSTSSSSVP